MKVQSSSRRLTLKIVLSMVTSILPVRKIFGNLLRRPERLFNLFDFHEYFEKEQKKVPLRPKLYMSRLHDLFSLTCIVYYTLYRRIGK